MGDKYTGDYCVELQLYFNTNQVCKATNCVITGTGCWQFSCDFIPVTTTQSYWVKVINAGRYPSGNCTTSGQASPGYYWWTQMSDCLNCPSQLSITF
jgi:hypothetical protein